MVIEDTHFIFRTARQKATFTVFIYIIYLHNLAVLHTEWDCAFRFTPAMAHLLFYINVLEELVHKNK